jgi:outer membrane immunogenic protein
MRFTRTFSAAGLSMIGALSLAGSAFSADMALKAPPVSAPAFSWSGFYLGGHVGAGWGTTSTTANAGAAVAGLLPGVALNLPIGQTSMNGFLGGLQAGYNWQTSVVVFGIEADFSGADIKGSTACVLILNCQSKADWTADVAGRLGVPVGDRGLLYVKGGVAWANSKYSVNQTVTAAVLGFGVNGAVNGSVSNTRIGGLLGAGVEYSFMPGWSAKLEYDYADFGTANLNLPVTATGTIGALGGATTLTLPISVKEQVHSVKIGANYHF